MLDVTHWTKCWEYNSEQSTIVPGLRNLGHMREEILDSWVHNSFLVILIVTVQVVQVGLQMHAKMTWSNL